MTTETIAELERMRAEVDSHAVHSNPWQRALERLEDKLVSILPEIIADGRDLAALRAREAARPVCGKTADGVEVRAGDRVYMSDNHREWYAAIAGTAMADGSYLRLVTDCYSTPEAARAAGEKT